MVKSFSRRQFTRDKKIAIYRISRGTRVVENAFGILVSRFSVLLGTIEQRPKAVRDIVLTCVVLHNMLRTNQGEADKAPIPANDIAALQNEQVVDMPYDNYRNPSKEAKYQRELMLITSIILMHWLGRITGYEMCQPTTLGLAGIYHSRTFI